MANAPVTSMAVFAGLLALLWVTLAFGNSLQPIAMITYAEPLCMLLVYEHLSELGKQSWCRSALAHTALLGTYGLGFAFAFQSSFAFPDSTPETWFTTFTAGILMGTLIIGLALVPQHYFRLRFPTSSWALYAYPVLLTCALTLSSWVVGSFHLPAAAVADSASAVQLVGLVGVPGVNFVIALLGSVLYQYCQPPGQQPARMALHINSCGFVLVLLMLVSSGRVYTGAFYQKNISSQLGQQLKASCVIGQVCARMHHEQR